MISGKNNLALHYSLKTVWFYVTRYGYVLKELRFDTEK